MPVGASNDRNWRVEPLSERSTYREGVPDDPADALREVEARIAEHPGYRNYAQASALLATIKHVVEPNWRELLAVLDAPNSNTALAMELVQNVREPQVRDRYRATLDQKLHNYLASAFTLVDHVRRIV